MGIAPEAGAAQGPKPSARLGRLVCGGARCGAVLCGAVQTYFCCVRFLGEVFLGRDFPAS